MRIGERFGDVFAEEGTRERGANQFVRFVGGHGDDSENGNPAAEFFFTEERDRFADAVNFAADGDEPGVEIAKEFVDEGGIGLEELFDGALFGHE